MTGWAGTDCEAVDPSAGAAGATAAGGLDSCGCDIGTGEGWSSNTNGCASGATTNDAETAACSAAGGSIPGTRSSACDAADVSTYPPPARPPARPIACGCTVGYILTDCLRFQVNGDGRVAVSDVLLVLAAFGIPVRMNGGGCAAVAEDVNGDCAVSVGDLLVTLSAFGMTC